MDLWGKKKGKQIRLKKPQGQSQEEDIKVAYQLAQRKLKLG